MRRDKHQNDRQYDDGDDDDDNGCHDGLDAVPADGCGRFLLFAVDFGGRIILFLDFKVLVRNCF
jgi:hypothetical protein